MKNLLFVVAAVLLVFSLYKLSHKNEIPHNQKVPGAFKALELWNHVRAFPNEQIPDSAYTLGFEKHQKQFLNSSYYKANGIEPMGPLNTTGRTLTVGINPQAERTIYAGSASGGLWRSRNLGLRQSWEYVETGFPILGVSTIEFAPQDSMVMYIGTGEVYNYFDTGTDGAYRSTRGSYGLGILKSIDGGLTWRKSLDWSYNQKHGVWMIKVSPINPDVVYAATTEGIYKSIDAGDNWSLINDIIMATDIDIDPEDDDFVVAAFGNLGTDGRGIYYTEDGGSSWQKTGTHDDFQGKILLTRSTATPNILYASIGNGFTSENGATQLMKSTDNGRTFDKINDFDYSRFQGWFAHDIAIDPFDDDNMIAVGIQVHKSRDGGLSFATDIKGGVTQGTPPINGPDGPPDYVHADSHFVTYHPTIKDLIIVACDGGVFLSFDNGINYLSANGGMQTTQFYNGFSVSDTDGDFALGGLQDNSTVLFRGSNRWQRGGGGDGSWTAINQQNNNIVYASAQNLYILRSLNNGQLFNNYIQPIFTQGDDPLFISPFVVSPNEPDVMYAGSKYVYKSINGGNTWSEITMGQFIDDGNPIFAMDVHSENSDIVYVATAPQSSPANVLSTFDGGVTWTSGNNGLPDNRVPNDIVVSDDDPSVAFVCFSGFGTRHLFRTNDGGDNWIPIDTDLPDVPGNAIAIDEAEGIIYFGTDIAVYSANYIVAGEYIDEPEWELYSEGMPMAAIVLDLKISKSDKKLWIATHGNGAYRGDLLNESVSTSDTDIESLITISPNPTSDRLYINNPSGDIISWDIVDMKGQLVISGDALEIDVSSIIDGSYVLSIKTQNGRVSQQFVVAK